MLTGPTSLGQITKNMNAILEMIKIICLFISIFFTFTNILRFSRGLSVPTANFVYWAIGVTGFVYLQFLYKS